MSQELVSVLVLVVVHLLGVAVLVGMLAGEGGGFRGWWPSDGPDDGGSPGDDRPRTGGPPLDDAEPSSLRLRGPGTLADAHRVARRRSAEPEAPVVPVRD